MIGLVLAGLLNLGVGGLPVEHGNVCVPNTAAIIVRDEYEAKGSVTNERPAFDRLISDGKSDMLAVMQSIITQHTITHTIASCWNDIVAEPFTLELLRPDWPVQELPFNRDELGDAIATILQSWDKNIWIGQIVTRNMSKPFYNENGPLFRYVGLERLPAVFRCRQGSGSALFGVMSCLPSIDSGGNGGTHSYKTKNQSDPVDNDLFFRSNGSVPRRISSFPLSAKIRLALIIPFFAAGVWARGSWRYWSSRGGLSDLAAHGALSAGLIALSAFFWDLASPY